MGDSLAPRHPNLRRFFGRSPVRHSRAPDPAPVSLPVPQHAALLDKTLQRLSDDDRQTLGPFISADCPDTVVKSALVAAEQQQKRCLEKRWKVTFHGRTIVLREQADKVVRLLNRFKFVGDIAVNADPVHAGLPWAGIRLLLEVAVADANHMASLLVGCETALYLACRLRVYVEFLQGLKACPSRDSLETAVIKLYKSILEFLAHAIRTYKAPTFSRTPSAIWDEGKVAAFENTCTKLAWDAHIEASNCDRIKFQEYMRTSLDELEAIHTGLDRIEVDSQIDKIPYASGAIYNALDSEHEMCHPETRAKILQQIRDWISQPDAKAIFWLSGRAGTGKSTISRTIAKELDQKLLAATFFFKRGEGDRGSSFRFFSTIVKQLVINIPEIKRHVADAIRLDPFLSEKALAEQFKKLILGPLTSVETHPAIVVVDALDECNDETHVRTIVNLWSRFAPPRLKLFLTSRPETPIRLEFSAMPQCYQNIELDEAPDIKRDLAVYLRYQLAEMDDVDGKPMGRDWIDQDTVYRLVDLSFPLFIIAATICRIVRDPEWDPKESLQEILDHQSADYQSKTELIYLPILTHVLSKYQESGKRDILTKQFQAIIGTVVCLVEPLSAAGLATLTGIPEKYVRLRLEPLRSVLSISDDQAQIRVLHLSFPEFLLSQGSRGEPFGVDGPRMHAMLTDYCLRLLSDLRQNPLGLSPGQLRADIKPSLIESHFSPALRYACRYWVHHLKESRTQIATGDFLRQHFLHWLEALSLLDCLTEAISFVETLIQIYPSDDFLEDARRFTLANRYIIDLAPAQTYISAILLAPQMSKVKATARIPGWLSRSPEAPLHWGPELQKLQGRPDEYTTIAISPDGSLLASGPHDEEVRLWEIKTGREVQCFGDAGYVLSIAFSLDGLELFSAAHDGMVRTWDIQTGQQIRTFDTGDPIFIALLSPDGLLIGANVSDCTIRLWQITTGQKRALTGHDDLVRALAISSSGFSLASGSHDRTARVWNVKNCQQTQILEHNEAVEAVEFSANGSLLASGTQKAIYIWDAVTGERMRTLQSHVNAGLAFSPDASLLACGSRYHIVDIWNIHTGQKLQSMNGHDSFICGLVFPRDNLVVSVSFDGTIRLWDIKLIPERETPGSDRRQTSLTFSPDGSLLATFNLDSVCFWNVNTGKMVQSKPAHSFPMSFSPDGSLLAWVSESCTVGLWDCRTGEATQTFREDQSDIQDISFSPESSSFAIATSRDNKDPKPIHTVYICDNVAGQVRHCFSSMFSVRTSAFSPTGSLIAVGGVSDQVVIWDIKKSQPTKHVYQVGGKGDIFSTSLAISQDEKLLAVNFWPDKISLWDLEAAQEVRVLEGVPIISRGVISLDADPFSFRSTIACPDDWIQCGDEKLVWLPRDYRPYGIDHHDGILAISQNCGGIGFWQLSDDRKFTV